MKSLLIFCLLFGFVLPSWGWAENRTFSTNVFSDSNIFRIGGNVYYTSNAIDYFPNHGGAAFAGAWWTDPMQIRGFETNFTMVIDTPPGGGKYDKDGIAFVITTNSNGRKAVDFPGSLGYGYATDGGVGFVSSVAIEFDSYQNTDFVNDPDSNHISLHVSIDGKENTAVEYGPSCPIGDGCIAKSDTVMTFTGQPMDVNIKYLPKDLNGGANQKDDVLVISMKRSSDSKMLVQKEIDGVSLSKYLNIANDHNSISYVGFTSSCGNDNTNQKLQVSSWSFKFLGVTNAKYSVVQGVSKGVAGAEKNFKIIAHDQFGYKMISGGANFKLSGTDSAGNAVSFSIHDLGNGEYQAWYNIKKSGESTVSLALDASPANGGNTIKIETDPADPSPAASNIVDSSVIDGKDFVAGTEHSFDIQLKDQFGNNVITFDNSKKKSLNLNLKLDSDAAAEPTFNVGNGNGLVTVTFSVPKVGDHQIQVLFGSTPISNSKHSFKIVPAKPKASETKVVGEVPSHGKTGLENTITFQLYDSFGNAATNTIAKKEDIKFTVTSNGDSENLDTQIETLKEGKVTVKFEALKVDTYKMHLSYKDFVIVNDVNIEIVTSGEIFPPKCIAEGEGLNYTKVGELATVKVTLMDSGSNPTGGDGQNPGFSLLFSSKNGKTKYNSKDVDMKVAPVQEGNSVITYNLTKAGSFQLKIMMNNTEIYTPEEGYWNVHAEPGVGWGPNSQVKDMPRETRTGEVQTFKLLTLDQFQNTRPFGGDKVLFQMQQEDSKVQLTVLDNKDSSYTLSYSMQSTGEYDLYVSVNGLQIKESPFKVKCIWAGLSTGTILAIAFGIIAFLFLAAVGFWVWKKKFAGKRLYQRLANQEPESLT